MKPILYILVNIILFFGFFHNLQAQEEVENPPEELINTEWYLTKLVIEEEDYPYMDSEVTATLEFYGYYDEEGKIEGDIETYFYEWDWAHFELEEANEIYSGGWQTMAFSEGNKTYLEDENIATPYLYFYIFWMNGFDVYEDVYHHYTITQEEDIKKLIIIDKDDNEAHFQNVLYLSVENQEKYNLVLYPNPAQEEIYIENLTATAEIEIYTISGKKLLQQQVNSSTESINISNLSAGVYLYAFKRDGKSLKTGKLIKE